MAVGLRLGLGVPVAGLSGAEHRKLFAKLRGLGVTDIWSAETARWDAFAPLHWAASVSDELLLGTSIANAFSRGRALLAMEANAVAEVAPGRFSLGIGSGTATTAAWNQSGFDRPVDTLRSTVRFLKHAFAGLRDEETGFRLESSQRTPIPVLLAALGPAMRRAAAESADGVLLSWVTQGQIPGLVRSASSARASIGYTADEFAIVCNLPVLITPDPTSVTALVTDVILRTAQSPLHLRAMERAAGAGIGGAAAAWAEGNRDAARRQLPMEAIQTLFAIGSAEACARRVADFVRGGVDVPILTLLNADQFEPPQLLSELTTLASEFRAAAALK